MMINFEGASEEDLNGVDTREDRKSNYLGGQVEKLFKVLSTYPSLVFIHPKEPKDSLQKEDLVDKKAYT